MNEWLHRLPRRSSRWDAAVDVVPERGAFLTSYLRGRSVIHLGFCDANNPSSPSAVGWLHEALAGTTDRLIGIDIDETGVAAAHAAGHDAYVADCTDPLALEALGLQPAEVVLASELIEHVDAPGRMLDAVHRLLAPGGELVVTTPNAHSLLNGLLVLGNRELAHPDHIATYSWYTLTNLLRRHDWAVRRFVTYETMPFTAHDRKPVARIGKAGVMSVLRLSHFAARHWAPLAAGGLIAICNRYPEA